MEAKVRLLARWALTILLLCFLSGCFIPDEFDLELSIPTPTEVGWNFNGKWQFFFAGYHPQKQAIPPKDLISLTSELGKLPGSSSVAHLEGNVWKQSISWRVLLQDSQKRPVPVLFPTSTQPTGGPDYWLVRISPESASSVLIETAQPPTGQMLKDFQSMGYKSTGIFTLKTSGTVEQIDGPPLSKSWFGGNYSTKWGAFQGPPLKIRIKW
jgi:hypothetical protein